jgi:hypothetical protein
VSAIAPGGAAAGAPADPLDALADEVLEIAGAPIDAWAVAATLESRGLRDVDAQRHGRADVFALADEVLVRCRARAALAPPPAAAPLARARRARSLRFARFYARGAFFFVSMGLQIGALLLLGYAQWASIHFTLTRASIVALAAGASFVATAGAVEALGLLGPRYREPGKDLLTERIAWWSLALGALGALLVAGALVVANALAGAPYSAHLVRVGLTYYALLSALWLVNGVLYMLRGYLAMACATVIGIACVAALHAGAGLAITGAQWIALGISIGLSLAWAAALLRGRARATSADLRLARFGPRRLLVRAAAAPLCFGTLYFLFIFCDRLVAWTAGTHPLPVWFDVSYELGLDLALVALVPAVAFLEPTLEAFAARVEDGKADVPASDVAAYNRALLRFHGRRVAATLALALAGAGVAVLAVVLLDDAGALGTLAPYADGDVSPRVFAWGAAGYALLAVGVLNASFLTSLARPWLVIPPLALALLTDVAVGLALSRGGAFWEAVQGLTAGAAAFALLTAALAARTLRRGDYHSLAAY